MVLRSGEFNRQERRKKGQMEGGSEAERGNRVPQKLASYMRMLEEAVSDLHRAQGIGLTRHLIHVTPEKPGPFTLAF